MVTARFEGVSFTRAGGATAIRTNQFRTGTPDGASILAFIGKGASLEPGVLHEYEDPLQALEDTYSGDLFDAIRQAYNSTNDPALPGAPTRVFLWQTNQATRAELTVQATTDPLPGEHTFTVAAPWSITPGGQFIYETDASGGPQTINFRATAAIVLASGAPTLPMANEFLRIATNGGSFQDIAFATEATLADVLNTINSSLHGAFARDNGGAVEIVSTLLGSSSSIQIGTHPTADAKTKLSLSAGTTPSAGPNDVANSQAVTAAEAKALIEAGGGVELDTTVSPPVLRSTTTGASSQLIISPSVPLSVNDSFGATAGTYNGATSGSPVNVIKFLARGWGVDWNGITITATDPSPTSAKRVLTITRIVDGQTKTQVSPELGEERRFSIEHIGAGTTVTMTLSATQIVLTSNVGAESLTLNFADYPTLDLLLAQIEASPYYDVTNEMALSSEFNPANLDWVSAVDLTSGAVDVYSSVWDVVDWTVTNGAYVTAEREATGATQFSAFTTAKALTGGTTGNEATSNYTDALNALAQRNVDTIVPLVSENRTTGGDSVSFQSVAVAVAAHCQDMTRVATNQNERRCWIGAKGNRAALEALATVLRPYGEAVTVVVDRHKFATGRAGRADTYRPEWQTAVAGAAMRASAAELGEPLVWKTIISGGVTQGYSASTPGEIEALIKLGFTISFYDQESGTYRFDKVLTMNGTSNNALLQESVYSGLLVLAKGWRRAMMEEFLGCKGTVSRVGTMQTTSEKFFDQYGPRESGGQDFLVAGEDEQGNERLPYDDLTFKMGVSPYPSDALVMTVRLNVAGGINHIFQTATAVPAQVQLSGV